MYEYVIRNGMTEKDLLRLNGKKVELGEYVRSELKGRLTLNQRNEKWSSRNIKQHKGTVIFYKIMAAKA